MKDFLILVISITMFFLAYDQLKKNMNAHVFSSEAIESVTLCNNFSEIRNAKVPYAEDKYLAQTIKVNVINDIKGQVCKINITREATGHVPQDPQVQMFANSYINCVLDEYGQKELANIMTDMVRSKIQDSPKIRPTTYKGCHFFVVKNGQWIEY